MKVTEFDRALIQQPIKVDRQKLIEVLKYYQRLVNALMIQFELEIEIFHSVLFRKPMTLLIQEFMANRKKLRTKLINIKILEKDGLKNLVEVWLDKKNDVWKNSL